MKNLLLSCLTFCSVSLHLSAQGADFAPLGAKWYYSEFSSIYPYPEEFRLVEVTAEETFQGHLCRKLEGLTMGCGLPNPSYIYSRNDSVFFWSPYTLEFELLYDFTVVKGKSWLIKGLHMTGGNDSIRVFVDSLGQRIIQGDTLKIWYVSYFGPYDWGNEILKKVGNSCFLSPSYGLCENRPCGLRCYSDAVSSYHFVNYACDTSIIKSGTSDLSEHFKIQVSPNPFQDKMKISSNLPFNDCVFRLYDSGSKLILELSLNTGNIEVDANDLPTGIYFWDVTRLGKRLGSAKVIKIEK